jgi:hypothetical protein
MRPSAGLQQMRHMARQTTSGGERRCKIASPLSSQAYERRRGGGGNQRERERVRQRRQERPARRDVGEEHRVEEVDPELLRPHRREADADRGRLRPPPPAPLPPPFPTPPPLPPTCAASGEDSTGLVRRSLLPGHKECCRATMASTASEPGRSVGRDFQ